MDMGSTLAKFAPFVNATELKIANVLGQSQADPRVLQGLASCHAVTRMQNQLLVGNQVEVRMFEATEWVLEESGGQPRVRDPINGTCLTIEKRFEFDHT
jgi:hypothetical protein